MTSPQPGASGGRGPDLTRWIFIRHGESTANAGRVLSGWDDVALTKRGVSQARRAGRLLAEQLHTRPHTISSDLQRAHDTARHTLAAWSSARALPPPDIITESRLRERAMGAYQGASIDALRRDGRMSALLGWQNHPPGGESLCDLAARCLSAVSEIDPPTSQPILIFAHGGVIRVLTGMLDGLTTEQIASRRIKNAAPMAREVAEGAWSACAARYLQTYK